MLVHLFLSAVLTLGLVACKSSTKRTELAVVEEDSNLSQKEAQERKAQLGDISYKIFVALNSTDLIFTGKSEITFDVKDNSSDLRLDFYEGKIQSLNLNGKNLDLSIKKKFWLELPSANLVVGKNTLTVNYTQDYATNGQGLHRFQDPQTKEVFLYSQFETFDANRFMPCFDQPDLKATYQLQVEAPKKWQVISTALESAKKVVGEKQLWNFPNTAKISTYLFSLHAGPYVVWKDDFEGLPLRLFARQTMAKFVDTKEWFRITKQGLKFYNSYYRFPYPFKKYDQLIVPEFNPGAMENIGAVTFTEIMISRSKMIRIQRLGIAVTILHEMAHMWFGDIVTMQWWNDLWLNESFATFMEQFSLEEATEYKESWLDFFSNTKQWAYNQDRMITSHPIEGVVPSVKDAFATFDGITYGKGASVLKQLKAYIGDTAFQDGIADYIQTNAYSNATRADFIAALQRHSDKDLNYWASAWLRQSHTDTVTIHWSCDNDTLLTEMQIEDTPASGTLFRPQTLQIALLNEAHKVDHVETVTLTARFKELKSAWRCPVMIYPNYQDLGFVSVKLDPQTFQYAKKNLSQISDELLRSQVWFSLWEMVLRSEISLKDYVKIVYEHFESEKNDIVLRQILKTEKEALDYWPETENEKDAKMSFVKFLETNFMKRFKQGKPGGDEQKLWFDTYVTVARSADALKNLQQWITHPDHIAPGFGLDIDRQWLIVHQLMRYQVMGAQEAFDDLKKRDPSDRGQKYALGCESVPPSLEIKKKFFVAIRPFKGKYTFQEILAISRTFFPIEQLDLAKNFENEFYDYFHLNAQAEDENHVKAVLAAISPLRCEAAASDKLKTFIASESGLNPSLRKRWLSDIDEDERCQRIRQKSF